METKSNSVVSSICVIAKKAPKIPLAIFTDLFHLRSRKKPYLELTLEILQQFYIDLFDRSIDFSIFVGDHHKYFLNCTRCHCAITRPDYIHRIMELAPMAMLWHFGILSVKDDFPHCPVLLPDPVVFEYAYSLFEHSRDESDDKEPSPFLWCNAITNHGTLRFCEATKVDLESWNNSKKNRNNKHDTTILSTNSLVSSLFVDLMGVEEVIETGFNCKKSEMNETRITVANSVIWNRGKFKEKNASYASQKDTNPPSLLPIRMINCGCTKHGVPLLTMNIQRTYYVC